MRADNGGEVRLREVLLSMRGKRGKKKRLRRNLKGEKESLELPKSSFEPVEKNQNYLYAASARKGRWKKLKLKEIISDPTFLGKTIRLGDSIFEVKGLDERIAQERRKDQGRRAISRKSVSIY
jgi:hypothetical protein